MSQDCDVDTVTHWGCQLLRADGSVLLTRWDPGHVPYTEAQARADVAWSSKDWPSSRKRLVSRTETTVVITTPWAEVPS